MKQFEKDALLKAENDSYSSACAELINQSSQLKEKYRSEQEKIRIKLIDLAERHYDKMAELNKLETEKSAWVCDGKVKNAIYATRKWLQDSLQANSDKPVSVRFDVENDVVTFSAIYS